MATQTIDADLAAAQPPPQVALHSRQVVLLGGDMEGIDHHLGRLIRWQRRQQLSPQLPPALTRQQVVLQLGTQQRPGFTAQTFDHVAEVNPP